MSDSGITAINEKVREESLFIAALRGEMEKVIVGQRYLLDRLMIGLLANGHLLLEGVPGLAKTLAVKTLAAAIHTYFHRIQFTPDLLPADLIGTQVYNPKTGDFGTRKVSLPVGFPACLGSGTFHPLSQAASIHSSFTAIPSLTASSGVSPCIMHPGSSGNLTK